MTKLLLVAKLQLSLPVRGAWLEIVPAKVFSGAAARRSPCGERGLKLKDNKIKDMSLGRSPCGERGLKFNSSHKSGLVEYVAPRAGSVD